MADTTNSKFSSTKRRFLLICASLAALYPIVRFLRFSIPRKPRIEEINKVIPAGGYHLGSDYILFDNGEKAWALSRRCTHLGCTINFHQKKNILECPCHQSRFSPEGRVLHGPAKTPLPHYKVERLKDKGGYLVTI
ncbi:MAG: ubiquinol-cytochrome c reductase iron-sulfur subunit [Desulfocapsa sp.]|nr:ubiquinol-cytochrome c reductase iron-sulfur subunit [Desulfocapsa sp.]